MIRFLSKVAFICNLSFLAALFILWMDHPPDGGLVSLIILMGFVLSAIFNAIVVLCYAFLLLTRKPLKPLLPFWLIIANFLFFIVQIIFYNR